MKGFLQSLPRNRVEARERLAQAKASPAINSLFWVLMGSGGYQFIRLASNLILTRLLFPEVFGLMAIVTALLVGIGMLSDVGLREGVVNSNRIDDPKFMQTAWTLQVLRGAVITVIMIAVAWPVAGFYQEAQLAPLIVAIAMTTFISGFKSIALLAYDKRLDLKTQMISDISVQIAGVSVTIVWAWITGSVWALVAGQWVSTFLELWLSYRLFTGHHSRFAWDTATIKKMVGFGKWIFISSLASYMGSQGDRLIMGIFLTLGELGKYSVATTWAAMVALVSINISSRVMHPYYRRAVDENNGYKRAQRLRNVINAAYIGICVLLALIGDWLVIFLYDDRYIEAGWMLQILALGQVGRALNSTLYPFILAQGDSFRFMQFSIISAIVLVASLFIGGTLAGSPGVIFGLAASAIITHPIMIIMVRRYGFHCALADIGLILLAAAICVAGWWLLDAPILDVFQSVLENRGS